MGLALLKKPIKIELLNILPFSFFGFVNKLLNQNKIKQILDVGCGDGSLMDVINFNLKYNVDGVDMFEPYIKLAKKTGSYQKIYKSNILTFSPNHKYDLVFSSHVIEHLTKNEGKILIKKMITWSRKLVVLMTPYGFMEQHEYDNNILQEHRSGWEPLDFEKEGFKVKIGGISSLFMKNDNDKLKNTYLSKIFNKIISVWYKASPPYMICYRET